MSQRIFIAINLPLNIKSELEKLKEEIQNSFPEEMRRGLIKWIKKENLHITLLFIGSVDKEKIIEISQITKEIVEKEKMFSLKFKKICYGPPAKIPPRLIWLELEKNPELLKLVERIKKEITKINVLTKIENRGFSPHITLGRVKSWQWQKIEPEERPDIEREVELEFKVNSVEIMESELKRSGAEYTILESLKLT